MRNNGGMPTPARPAGSDGASEAINHIGNMVKAGIIRHLRNHPNSGAKSIIDALMLPRSTIAPYLSDLETAGLIDADPPRAERSKGEWVTYRVNDEEVTALYLRLGQEIGEI